MVSREMVDCVSLTCKGVEKGKAAWQVLGMISVGVAAGRTAGVDDEYLFVYSAPGLPISQVPHDLLRAAAAAGEDMKHARAAGMQDRGKLENVGTRAAERDVKRHEDAASHEARSDPQAQEPPRHRGSPAREA